MGFVFIVFLSFDILITPPPPRHIEFLILTMNIRVQSTHIELAPDYKFSLQNKVSLYFIWPISVVQYDKIL